MVAGIGGWARVPEQHGACDYLAQLSRQTLLGIYGIGQHAFGGGEKVAGFHGDRPLSVQGDQAWVVVVEECLHATQCERRRVPYQAQIMGGKGLAHCVNGG